MRLGASGAGALWTANLLQDHFGVAAILHVQCAERLTAWARHDPRGTRLYRKGASATMDRMLSSPKLTRRWFRYSLSTLFIAMTIVGLALGWVTRSKRWIQQRHALLTRDDVYGLQVIPPLLRRPIAPGGLWVFGERGQPTIRIATDSPLSEADRIKVNEARRLFPESTLWLRSSNLRGRGVVNIDLAPGEDLPRKDR